MSLVGELRELSGLTQAEFAARANTSRTRLSAYEHGHTDPGLEVLTRLALAAGRELVPRPAGSREFVARVAGIADSVAAGDDSFALRLTAELVDAVRSQRLAVQALATDPGSTGSRRWDALIGGVTELLAHEHGVPVPAWASAPGRFTLDPWFVSRRRSIRPFVLVETPAALAARNVFLTAASLTGV